MHEGKPSHAGVGIVNSELSQKANNVTKVTTGKQELARNKEKLKCLFLISETALALL